MKKRAKYVLIIVILLLAGAAIYGYHLYNERNPSLRDVSSAMRLTADELFTAFDKDEAAATRQFSDKVLSVRGLIRQMNKDEKGGYTLYLSTPELLKSISCSLDSLYRGTPPEVKAGDSITIKGICTGYLMDVVLVRCVIEN